MILRFLGAAFLAALVATAFFFSAPAWLHNQGLISAIGGALIIGSGFIKPKTHDGAAFVIGAAFLFSGLALHLVGPMGSSAPPPFPEALILWFVVFAFIAILMAGNETDAAVPSAGETA